MRLADDDIRAVLARAEEIQGAGFDDVALRDELEALIQAAAEVGISRSAVERALRERFDLPERAPTVGELTFARSTDNKYYVASVLAASAEGFRVRFLTGSEHTVSIADLRPCTFLPGERVVCSWPWWGPWTCTVVSYNAATQQVTLSDGWGETKAFPIDSIWLNPTRRSQNSPRTRVRIYATLLGAGATVGAIIGSLLTALVLR